MTGSPPPFQLGREQAERLLQYMQDYRRSALASMPPTHERNTTLRLVQALQGRLLAQLDHEQAQIQLALDTEEVTALIAMTNSLLVLYGEKLDAVDRAKKITDLGTLYAYLRRNYG
ncbi:hypothetical protein [Ktedonobacter racemifer]|uniref:Uncharacterized protein n=1 Tax=Ktedonobacter racemifer DSM 44963 TaxID=485913 RepID=D6U179_KTERA|nr:hypothetical protein [Ktedonobacter racemifer]EFH82569.1 hypothetical protein Krac_3392 [Ktedonobacter racemifer DSM 44963]